jgi:hypothetical protein
MISLLWLNESPQQVQQMIDCLAEFCEACCAATWAPCMTVDKTNVFFNRKLAPAALPTANMGQPLPVNAEFRYLKT